MEKFIQRENVLLEFGSSRGISENSGSTLNKDSEEMDFNDVFGGPPRRYSMQEVRVRYSFGESVESEEERASSPWMVLKEKPVFGEENVARRRHQGDGFYDDIFKADESRVGSPRKSDRDRDRDGLLWSSPSSRNMSPVRRSPSKADLLGTSLPAQLSLPAQSSKAVELPAFGSQDYKTDDSTKVVNSPRSTSGSFSRFLTRAIKGKEENRNEHHSVIRPSPLSREPSLSSEDSSSKISSIQKGNIVEKLNKETKIADSDGSQFHFSIYTWAGIGVPMVMPLLDVDQLKSKDIGKYNKSASSNGKMGDDSSESKRPTVANQDLSVNAVAESLKMETGKKDLKTKNEAKEQKILAEEIRDIPEPKTQNKEKDRVDLVGARRTTKSVKVKSVDEIDQREKTAKKVATTIKEVLKSKGSTVRECNEAEQAGKVSEVKEEIKTGSAKGSRPDERISKNVKTKEGTRADSDSANVEKSSSLSGVTPSKSGVKGKVKEFVHIFNQDIDSKPKADVQTRSQSARWKAVNVDQTENEVSMNEEKVNLHYVDKKPDVPLKVDKNLSNDEPKQSSFTKNPSRRSDRSSANQKNTFSSESIHRDRPKSLDADDPFEVNFVVEELFEDQEKAAQSDEGSEDMAALDFKIRQWSVGKKGNIRSLLSTLQYVLWPGSGWKPVPLVDLIEANSVKRAYQKALLRIHPDKLQQKGAESTQKFIAEKVFDILQEAWDHFNTLAAL